MNTNDLVDAVATQTGASKADAKKLVDSVFSAIADAPGWLKITAWPGSISKLRQFRIAR